MAGSIKAFLSNRQIFWKIGAPGSAARESYTSINGAASQGREQTAQRDSNWTNANSLSLRSQAAREEVFRGMRLSPIRPGIR